MKKFNSYILLVPIGIYLFFTSCLKDANSGDFDYTIVKKADLTNLLIVEYSPDIYAIDTTDFTVKAHIRVDDMEFGGAVKLPNGGIAFTNHNRISNNSWGHKLYVTDNNCNLLNKYDICPSPIAPVVVNNLLMVGSSSIDSGVTFKYQIYNANNFKLLKEFQLQSMVDAWQVSICEDKAYFGICPSGEGKNGYIVELDLITLDTTMVFKSRNYLYENLGSAVRNDSLLYIFNSDHKSIYIYNLNTKLIDIIGLEKDYPQIASFHANRLRLPKIKNGYLFGFYEKNDNSGYQITYWAKFDPLNLKLIEFKKIAPMSDAVYFETYEGNYFVMRFYNKNVVFLNYETGNVDTTIVLDTK